MIELGRRQKLQVVKKVEFGVYLGEKADAKEQERVLLPAKQVPAETKVGDELEVFIYRDLEKDLLLPYKEQTVKVKKDQEVLVALYIDKSDRLCATMKVYPYLKTQSPYVVEDQVEGRIYEISDNFGVFVAVDDQYSGLIPKTEAQGQYRPGEKVSCRVTNVREDGKLNLSPRKKAYQQMDEDSELVLKVIGEYAGVLPFDDKVSPEVIKREFGLSKAAFKRAVGHLLKEKKIKIQDKRIYLIF